MRTFRCLRDVIWSPPRNTLKRFKLGDMVQGDDDPRCGKGFSMVTGKDAAGNMVGGKFEPCFEEVIDGKPEPEPEPEPEKEVDDPRSDKDLREALEAHGEKVHPRTGRKKLLEKLERFKIHEAKDMTTAETKYPVV
jgi:hypothetical protein